MRSIVVLVRTLKLSEWLRSSFPMFSKNTFYRRHALTIVCILILIFFLPKNTLKATHSSEPDVFYNEYRVAADWVKANYNPVPSPIIEYAHSVSFYSGVQSLQLPRVDPPTLIRFAHDRGARLIVIDDKFTIRRRKRPELNILVYPERYSAEIRELGMKLVYCDANYFEHMLLIYELQ